MTHRIQTGEVVEIQAFIVDHEYVALTGSQTITVNINRRSDNNCVDWDDYTFKSSSWISRDAMLTESCGEFLPGLYYLSGGFDTSQITNANPNDVYTIYLFESGSEQAYVPGPEEIEVGDWVEYIDSHVSAITATVALPGDEMSLTANTIAGLTASIWNTPNDDHLTTGSTGDSVFSGSTRAGSAAQVGDSMTLTANTVAAISASIWDALNSDHLNTGSTGDSLLSATFMQPGGDVVLTSASIDSLVNSIWDEPNGEHVITGTTGDSLLSSSVGSLVILSASIDDIADAVWTEPVNEYANTGTMGGALRFNRDVAGGNWQIVGSVLALSSSDGSLIAEFDLKRADGSAFTSDSGAPTSRTRR